MFLIEEMRDILVILTRPVVSITENRVVIRKIRQRLKRPSRQMFSMVFLETSSSFQRIRKLHELSIFLYINSRIDNACSLKIVEVFFFKLANAFLKGRVIICQSRTITVPHDSFVRSPLEQR